MNIRRLLPLAMVPLALGCTPTEVRLWAAWHAEDPEAAVAYAQQPEVVAALASATQPVVRSSSGGGCDAIYDEMVAQGASGATARRFAYSIAPRESGCTPQFVHDRDDWSYSRFGLNGLTANLRANWQAWCGADVRTDTRHLATDVACALAAHARMGWAPWT